MALLKPGAEAAQLSLALYLVILGCATYGLGRALWGPWTGLLAALIALTSPLVIVYSTNYFLELPLIAMVALATWALVRSQGFTSRPYTLMFGLAAGLGMLTKWSFIFFLAPMFLFALFLIPTPGGKHIRHALYALVGIALLGLLLFTLGRCSWFAEFHSTHFWWLVMAGLVPLLLLVGWWGMARRVKEDNRPWHNLAGAFLVFALLVSPWYLPNLEYFTREFFRNSIEAGMQEGDPGLLSTRSWTYYAYCITHYYFVTLLNVYLLVGVIDSLWVGKSRSRNSILLVGVAGSWLLFTLILNKDVRYWLPVVPMAAVLMSYWVAKRGWLAWILALPLLLSGLMGLFGWALPAPPAPDHFFYERVESVNIDVYQDLNLDRWLTPSKRKRPIWARRV